MPWVKFCDNFDDHHKVIQAGPLATRLFISGVVYSGRHLTDGFLAESVWSRIGFQTATHVIAQLGSNMSAVDLQQKLTDALINANLLEQVEGGYQIHDYLDWNPSSASIATKRSKDAKRKRGQKIRKTSTRNPRGLRTISSAPEPDPEPEPISTSPSPSKGKKLPRIPIPADWKPNEKHTAYCEQLSIDLDEEARKFRRHAEANDRRMARWDPTFMDWLEKSVRKGWAAKKTPEGTGSSLFKERK